jgi:hypothetical protein
MSEEAFEPIYKSCAFPAVLCCSKSRYVRLLLFLVEGKESEREERFVSMYRPSSYLPDLMSVASEGLALNGDHVCSLLSASIRSALPARRTETILAQLYASTDVIAPSGKLFGFVHCISDHSQNFPRYRSPFLCFLSLRYMETRLQLLLLFYRSCKV